MIVAIIPKRDGGLLSSDGGPWYHFCMKSALRLIWMRLFLLGVLLAGFTGLPAAEPLYELKNLAAWCIVPFDNQKRTPEQRAAMVAKMGLTKVAYDWRQEHVAEFEAEILAYKKHGIEFFAFWSTHDQAFALFEKHQLHPQIWVMAGNKGDTQEAKVKNAAEGLLPVIAKAAKIGSKVAIYNHGGWSGEPENMVAICEYLKKHHAVSNVGIVYNLHHGHGHLARLDEALKLMLPHLLCLNLNGMDIGGDTKGRKILPIGVGSEDLKVLRQVRASGYAGPIGILNHTMEDAEGRLLDNLDGLRHLVPQLDDLPPGPKPMYRTYAVQAAPMMPIQATTTGGVPSLASEFGKALRGGQLHPASEDFFRWPFTVELRCKLESKQRFNILAAGGPKANPRHWEIYSYAGTGRFSVYLPGRGGEYQSQVDITDGKWHDLLVSFSDEAVTLWVDGREALSRKPPVAASGPMPEKVAIGRLVEGTLGCDGSIDDVRISRGVMKPRKVEGPRARMDNTIALWSFDDLGAVHVPPPAPAMPAYEPARAPLDPSDDVFADHPVNRDRIFDFYAKQAAAFRGKDVTLIPGYPGLDGGRQGHWGNQNDAVTWKDGRWNLSDKGVLFSGVLRSGAVMVTKGIAVKKGDEAACFDPVSLSFPLRWEGGFVKLSEARHGMASGPAIAGKVTLAKKPVAARPDDRYLGLYRHGDEVVFAYQRDGKRRLISAWEEDEAKLQSLTHGGPARWTRELETQGTVGDRKPFAVDTIRVPFDNPYGTLFFLSGLDFFEDGSAAACTMTGEVWLVGGLDAGLRKVTWKRYATGLHQPLGLKVVDGKVLVLGRDQITRLHDLNGDREADYYENVVSAYETSPGGHDFIVGLDRDSQGRFYTASGKQGVLRLTPPDKVEVLATGLRNPNGIGVDAAGRFVSSSVQEGDWTPASAICEIEVGFNEGAHFGGGGPREGKAPTVPLLQLPRGEDNSSSGQVYLGDDAWPKLSGQGNLLHASFGTGSVWVVSRQKVGGVWQGAAQRISGAMRSGAQHLRFNRKDGHLYVSGMQGWGSYTPDDGSLQRIRHVGGAPVLVGHEVRDNGVLLRFDAPLGADAAQAGRHFAQAWNYLYGRAYGSPEYSVRHPSVAGHDVLKVASAHLMEGGRQLFLEIPQLTVSSQVHLQVELGGGATTALFLSAHALGEPFKDFKGYQPIAKQAHGHAAVASQGARAVRWETELCGPDPVILKLQAGNALNYLQKELRAKAGRSVALTFENPDVMPHNWVLVRPGAEEKVGAAAALMVSLSDGADRHYVPDVPEVVAHTRLLDPGKSTTIYFTAPKVPGRYPYLCSFPGHAQLMRGVLIVE
jgi:azurin/sugar phosphate isomerase/epimerase